MGNSPSQPTSGPRVKTGGCTYAFGRGEYGQLGLGDGKDHCTPHEIRTLTGHAILQAACGNQHTMAVLETGLVFSWGSGFYGILGRGSYKHKTRPRVIPFLEGLPVVSIACSATHSLAVTRDGEVFSWGRGNWLQLGHDLFATAVPYLVESLVDCHIIQVACGAHHSLFLTVEGEVYSCGRGSWGQLGLNGTAMEALPRKVMALDGRFITQIAAGGHFSLAITKEGSVYSWGRGASGQLGINHTRFQLLPQEIEAFHGMHILAVSASNDHAAAINGDGALFEWGKPYGRSVDHGLHLIPRQVMELKGLFIVSVACGHQWTVAVAEGGDVYSWGCGSYGQLGHEMRRNESFPRLIEGLQGKGVRGVATGFAHTICFSGPSSPQSLFRLALQCVVAHLPRYKSAGFPPLPDEVSQQILVYLRSTRRLNLKSLRLFRSCDLSRVNLANYEGVTDEWLVELALHSHLRMLDLTNCALVTREGLNHLRRHLPRLVDLRVDGCCFT